MTRVPATRTLENALRRVGFINVAGVDEVGRGCLAGPVVAAAVVLHPDRHVAGVSDSKAVPAEEREILYEQITRCAIGRSGTRNASTRTISGSGARARMARCIARSDAW